MSRIFNVVLNLSIGVKLGITSGLAVLLVTAMLVSQLHGNATGRELDANAKAPAGYTNSRAGY